MVIFAKSGAGKSVTMKTLISRSAVLMGIQSLALDAEGEYSIVAESLGGINVVISPNSKTVINIFDIETEIIKDEITGRDRLVLNVENKVEDVTQALLTMARGSTRSEEVNELTKQIIAESVAEEYASHGITNDPNSLFESDTGSLGTNMLGRARKNMPTIGSWYRRIQAKAQDNMNERVCLTRTGTGFNEFSTTKRRIDDIKFVSHCWEPPSINFSKFSVSNCMAFVCLPLSSFGKTASGFMARSALSKNAVLYSLIVS